jgi:hypothetical protein
LHLVIVAVAGVGIALFCSAYTVPEGCSPSITLNAPSPVCAASVGVEADVSCNSDEDTITETKTSTQLSDHDWYSGIWQGTVPLAKGVNKLFAYSEDLNKTSAECDVLSSHGDGSVWDRTEVSHSSTCESSFYIIHFNLVCACLPQADYAYLEHETTDESSSDKTCYDPSLDPPGTPATTDAYATYHSDDNWGASCRHINCSVSFTLTRHIYDPLVGIATDVSHEDVNMAVEYVHDAHYFTRIHGGGADHSWSTD